MEKKYKLELTENEIVFMGHAIQEYANLLIFKMIRQTESQDEIVEPKEVQATKRGRGRPRKSAAKEGK